MKKNILIIFSAVVVFIVGFFGLILFKKPEIPTKKLTFWSIQLKPVYEKQMLEIIKNFEQKNNCKVVWVDIPIQEAQKRTLASVLSSNPPDLVNLNPDFSSALAQKNALQTFANKNVVQFNKNLVNQLKYNNKIYALPFYATSPVTIYRKDILDKCNIKQIKTYSDLNVIAKDVNNCSKIPVFSGSINENDTFSRILNKYNVYDFSSEYQKKQAFSVYSLFNKLYKNDFLPKDVLSINHRENIEKYMSNQAYMIVAGSNFINMIKQNSPEIYSKSSLSNQLTGDSEKYDVSLMNLIIPLKAKNKRLALEFALEITNEKNQLEFAKLTNVLPANENALKNEYFTKCDDDLYEQSRCISAKQLNNLSLSSSDTKNKKEINEEINKTLEEILLNKSEGDEYIKNKIDILSKQVKILKEN